MKTKTILPKAVMLATGVTLAADEVKPQDFGVLQEDVIIVFDGSRSMWGQVDGTAKIEIARGVIGNLLGDWTDDRRLGMIAYGHRRRGDCSDIETLVAPAVGTAATIMERINAISPIGKTPLTTAVEQAAQGLAYTDRPGTVVLLSDGLESCNRDPCALADTLEKGGVDFTAHVVGFGLGKNADAKSLACVADRTGGKFLSAENASELSEALSQVSTAIAEPEPAPQPEVTVQGPKTATVGSTLDVSWTPSFEKRDYVTIVPAGADDGVYRNYIRVKDRSAGRLRAPSDAGLYELRYVSDASGETLGRASIEINKADMANSASGKNWVYRAFFRSGVFDTPLETVSLFGDAYVSREDDGQRKAVLDGDGDYISLGRLEPTNSASALTVAITFQRDGPLAREERIIWKHNKFGIALAGNTIKLHVSAKERPFYESFDVSDGDINDREDHRLKVLVDAAQDRLKVILDGREILDDRNIADIDLSSSADDDKRPWMLGTPWNRYYNGSISGVVIDDEADFSGD